ncbi:hypothetical protein LSAT2_020949 [Lamellibrachia satsuma]|nr:hypothetical protein LSAT2_020949 [Lamellibrachia satsuma]
MRRQITTCLSSHLYDLQDESIKASLEERSETMKRHYDRNVREDDLSPLHPGHNVRVLDKPSKTWYQGTVTQRCEEPRSYIITTPGGSNVRRNRRHLRKTIEMTGNISDGALCDNMLPRSDTATSTAGRIDDSSAENKEGEGVLCEESKSQEETRMTRSAKTSTSDEKYNGSLQSPNYPGPYALNGDVYTYTIYSPGKYIRLKFDGYDLSGQSTIQIYYIDKKGARESFTQGGAEPRIAVALSYEYLKVIFTAENRTNNQVPYLGFHARYEYTAVASWSEVPNVVRGKYFHRQPGGHFESPDCLPGDRVDCLWVIGSPSEVGASRVLVNFEENHYVDQWQLEIRRGITSDAPLVNTTRSVFSSSGVYIRLKYDCQRSAFKATFTYFVPTNSYNSEL